MLRNTCSGFFLLLDSILSTLFIFSFANASKTLGYKTFLSVDKGIVGKKKSKVECCWFLTVSTLLEDYIKSFWKLNYKYWLLKNYDYIITILVVIRAWTFICYDNIFSFVILAFMLKSNFICLHYSSIFINKMLLITFQTIILTTLRLIFIITNSTIAFVISLYNLDRMRVCVTPKATAYRKNSLVSAKIFLKWNEW